MFRVWRLLREGAASGPWNMGVDEALLETARGGGPPTLRFYRWSGLWLSLGYAQQLDPDELARCERAGVSVVRRITGGRAVLHGADLTYSVAAPEGCIPGDLRASVCTIGDALGRALGSLGVVTEVGPSDRAAAGAYDCFAGAGQGEISAAGRKLAGGAQRRVSGAVLQHGSIRLAPDEPAARAAAGLEADSASNLRDLGVEHRPEVVADACAEALAGALSARLEPGSLAPGEGLRAAERERQHARNPLGESSISPGGISRAHPGGR